MSGIPDLGGYATPLGVTVVEEVIRRSRFRTTLARADTVEEAKATIAAIRAECADATHNCWAYLVGPPGTTSHVGYSDDGEPQGTAGQPMLKALLHSDVGDVVAVCTRYYGGVKLGTGGLARAYAGGVKLAMEQLATEQKVARSERRFGFAYADVEPVRKLLEKFGVLIRSESFGVQVDVTAEVPVSTEAALRQAFTDLTRGAGQMSSADSGDVGDA